VESRDQVFGLTGSALSSRFLTPPPNMMNCFVLHSLYVPVEAVWYRVLTLFFLVSSVSLL